MANLLKEIGKRVTLYDLVQDVDKINRFKFVGALDVDRVKKWYRIGAYANLVGRGVTRLCADAALVYWADKAHENQEIMPLLSGAAICVFGYLLDYYIFDKNDPGYWRNDGSE
ncbi:MAG: hypothetical protein Q8R47_02765 [Nanoarchaeota archaeon]|nr:hypothetical protein [Nanoarchaeota archaeon]